MITTIIRKFGQLFGGGADRPQASESEPHWFKDKLSGFWFGAAAAITKSRQWVTHDSALMNTTIYGCVRIIAEEAAMLPLKFYKDRDDGGKELVKDSAPGMLLKRPNPWQTEFEFREWMFACLALRGNAYAEVLPGRAGLIPLHPGRVEAKLENDGRVVYKVQQDSGEPRTLQQFQVFHLRLMSKDGVTGMSPVELMRETIGLDDAARDHAATFFGNQAKPGGFITTKSPLTEESFEMLANDVAKFRNSEDRYKTPVFSVDLDWKQIGLSNKDSQWLESRKFTRAEIAAIWRVPLHMINDLDGAKFNNMELQDLSLLKHTLMPYLNRYEQRVGHTLIYDDIPEEEGLRAEFLAEGLLRGDSKTRSEFYRAALGGPGVGSGWTSVNEVRLKENLPLLDDPRADMVYLGETPTDPAAEEPPQEEDPPKPPPAEEDDNEPTQDSVDALAPMIADVTARLLKIEQRNIARRAKHATEDPDRFAEWCQAWFHTTYGPLCIAEMKYLAEAAGCAGDVEHIAANYCIGRFDAVVGHFALGESCEPFAHQSAITLLTEELQTWVNPVPV